MDRATAVVGQRLADNNPFVARCDGDAKAGLVCGGSDGARGTNGSAEHHD